MTPGIVHLGVGAFHRAHQASYVDDCLAGGESGWGIVGASLRSAGTRDALGPQDGLYALAARSSEGETLRVIGSIMSLLVAPESPAALVAALCDPRIRVVTLTITEKAYLRNASGGLDARTPTSSTTSPVPAAQRPRMASWPKRWRAGAPRERRRLPLCCDNLPVNGATLRKVMLDFAASA